jgi:branched-chain amino acid aminotransferase
MNYCWKDGIITEAARATINVRDIGVLRGYGLYDALTVFNNKPFRVQDHFTRLKTSAQEFGIALPYSDEVLVEAIIALSRKYEQNRCVIKIILTGGEVEGGIDFNPANSTLYILSEPFTPLAQHYYEQGAKAIITEYQRHYPQSKTTDYINAVRLQKAKKEAGALEVMYVSQGMLLEGATSNFGIVIDGTVVFPKNNIFQGVTRKVVIELAQDAGIRVEERDVTMGECWGADELFLTSSFKDIVPFVEVDGKKIGQGTPGPTTKKLINIFAHYLQNS